MSSLGASLVSSRVLRVQRVPAAGVVVDDVAQPWGQLGEELLTRQSP